MGQEGWRRIILPLPLPSPFPQPCLHSLPLSSLCLCPTFSLSPSPTITYIRWKISVIYQLFLFGWGQVWDTTTYCPMSLLPHLSCYAAHISTTLSPYPTCGKKEHFPKQEHLCLLCLATHIHGQDACTVGGFLRLCTHIMWRSIISNTPHPHTPHALCLRGMYLFSHGTGRDKVQLSPPVLRRKRNKEGGRGGGGTCVGPPHCWALALCLRQVCVKKHLKEELNLPASSGRDEGCCVSSFSALLGWVIQPCLPPTRHLAGWGGGTLTHH